MEAIAERLASVEGLYFPGAIHQGTPLEASRRKSDLFDLLSRDASIFLGTNPTSLLPLFLFCFVYPCTSVIFVQLVLELVIVFGTVPPILSGRRYQLMDCVILFLTW